MRIRKLDVENFRAIERLSLEFGDAPATVLVGPNGAGKSTILDCIAVAVAPLFGMITGEITIDEPGDDLSWHPDYDSKKQWHNIVERAGGGYQYDWPMLSDTLDLKLGCQHCTVEIAASIGGSKAIWGFHGALQSPQKASWKYHDLALIPIAKRVREKIAKDPQAAVPLSVYYPVNRYVLDFPRFWDQEELIGDQLLAYVGALARFSVTFLGLFRWFRYREDLENENRLRDASYRDRQMEAVRRAIEKMVPGFSDPRVKRNPPRMVVTKRDLESGSEAELQIEQLSGGEKNLLAMIADLARRLAIANPGLEDPLQGEALVLIDEVDLHLHPAWQRMIIPSLIRTFPKCQFIVGTHSPQVISEVETQSVYLLRQASGVITAEGPFKRFGRDSNRILEELMGVPERPKDIQDKLLEYFRLIDAEKAVEAKRLRKDLEEAIGTDEPEFVTADVITSGREILGQ